jgi:hypothetical protein
MTRALILLALAGCLTKPPRPSPEGVARHWRQRTDAGQPGPIAYAKLAYDPDQHVMLMFDGTFDTMWQLGAVGGWTQLCKNCLNGGNPTTPPAFTYDRAHARAIHFGGCTNTPTCDGRLRSWNGSAWIDVPQQNAPPARDGADFVYDSTHERVLLMGGDNFGLPIDEVWYLDGNTWTQSLATNAPAMDYSGTEVADDPDHERILVFEDQASGGNSDALWAFADDTFTSVCMRCTGSGHMNGTLVHVPGYDQTFYLDSTPPGTFELVNGAIGKYSNEDMPPRDASGIAYDSDRDAIVVYGGNVGGTAVAETWELVQ